ncbi:glycosyltransferase [Brevibacterium aurantiacum]|uniref:Glycosyltransferase n=1 Tax=Brevibacterium aurantiacum TaxID=273384 RepID=A0A556C4D4_BREAU|nr:glycosyltransferase [Brevibacterium aurantiacum]TSI12240.1 glycosyltransferase [Brevibacterium aurantiacum]
MSLFQRLLRTVSEGGTEVPRRAVVAGTDRVHVYSATWGIPQSIGGMTTAALRRIRSFENFGQPLSQTLLTFSPRMDADEARDRLLSEGRIDVSLKLLNVWQDLRGRSDSECAELGGMTPTDPVPEEDGEVESITDFYDVFRAPGRGRVLRRNYLRTDGSLLLADVSDPKIGRRFVLYSSAGAPMAEWRRPRDFYNSWISSVISEDPAVLIVDDKKISEFVHEITDRKFALILFMHGSHLRQPWNGAHGEFLQRRVETMRNFDRFDVVGVQTQQQAVAMRARGISGANIRLLTGELPPTAVVDEAPTDRLQNSGVMIANLIGLKRVDHAIRAVAKLKDRGVDVTLTVLGEGAERPRLEKLITELDVGDRIELPGYVNDVPARLQAASFSVLTSTSEGLPLAMMESMGSGCVPIVYDITYGPQDLVTSGCNGFITPRGDIDGLADQIESFLEIEPERVASMRAAAVDTVANYLPEVGYRRWKKVLEELEPVPLLPVDPRKSGEAISVKAVSVTPTPNGSQVAIEFNQIADSTAAGLQLVLTGRTLNSYFLCSKPKIESRKISRVTVATFSVDDGKFSESDGEIFDVFLRRPHDPWNGKRRIRTPKEFIPARSGGREWYSTKHGNLSVRPRA